MSEGSPGPRAAHKQVLYQWECTYLRVQTSVSGQRTTVSGSLAQLACI